MLATNKQLGLLCFYVWSMGEVLNIIGQLLMDRFLLLKLHNARAPFLQQLFWSSLESSHTIQTTVSDYHNNHIKLHLNNSHCFIINGACVFFLKNKNSLFALPFSIICIFSFYLVANKQSNAFLQAKQITFGTLFVITVNKIRHFFLSPLNNTFEL